MFCYGVCNHSPDQVVTFLTKRKVIQSLADVELITAGTILKKTPKSSVVFFLSISDFLRNVQFINGDKMEQHQVFVFGSPLRLNELNDCYILDMEHNPSCRGLGFTLLHRLDVAKYRQARKSQDVHRKTHEYLTVLTDNIKVGSLLGPLMTYIYTLPSSSHQTPVREAVCRFIYYGKPLSELTNVLDEIKGIVISKRTHQALMEILDSEVGRNYVSAFKEYREKKKDGSNVNLAPLCRKFNVHDFEMKYIKANVEDNRRSTSKTKGKKTDDAARPKSKPKSLGKAKPAKAAPASKAKVKAKPTTNKAKARRTA